MLGSSLGACRESGEYGFTGGAEFYALVTRGFQRAADAQLGHHSHTMEDENKLLRSLAALKEEFGLPDRYRIEPGDLAANSRRTLPRSVSSSVTNVSSVVLPPPIAQLINTRKTSFGYSARPTSPIVRRAPRSVGGP